MPDALGIAGKVLLVTNGASGISAAAVRFAAASGAKVCVADLDLVRAEALAREPIPAGRRSSPARSMWRMRPASTRWSRRWSGYTDTPLIGHVSDEPRLDLAAREPLGRFAQPEEIARQAIWLLSDNSSFVTGAAFTVDGGYSAT